MKNNYMFVFKSFLCCLSIEYKKNLNVNLILESFEMLIKKWALKKS